MVPNEDKEFEEIRLTSPREALAKIVEFKPDLVITDYQMPEISGLDVLFALQAIPADRRPAAFVLSGETNEDEIAKLKTAGAALVIDKAQGLRSSILNLEELFAKAVEKS